MIDDDDIYVVIVEDDCTSEPEGKPEEPFGIKQKIIDENSIDEIEYLLPTATEYGEILHLKEEIDDSIMIKSDYGEAAVNLKFDEDLNSKFGYEQEINPKNRANLEKNVKNINILSDSNNKDEDYEADFLCEDELYSNNNSENEIEDKPKGKRILEFDEDLNSKFVYQQDNNPKNTANLEINVKHFNILSDSNDEVYEADFLCEDDIYPNNNSENEIEDKPKVKRILEFDEDLKSKFVYQQDINSKNRANLEINVKNFNILSDSNNKDEDYETDFLCEDDLYSNNNSENEIEDKPKRKRSGKKGEIRRPRMRGGLRRGRGVRVRGGRGSAPGGPSPVADVVEVVDRGGPSWRGRGRGERANLRHERPGPHSIDELVIRDIDELPEGRGLETAMHPKRMHMWQAFVECHRSSLPASPMQHLPPPPCPRSHQYLRDEDISDLLNYGSDVGSDESGDEEINIVPQFIPRVIRSILETPLDVERDAAAVTAPASVPTPESVPAPAGDFNVDFVPPTATDQPWSLYDFQWTEFPNVSNPCDSRRETFSQNNVGPTTPRDDPYDIFIDIWDRQFMEHIASETNKYAQQVVEQMIRNHCLHPNSRIGKWRDTTADELYLYFAVILSMGIVVKSRLDEYWYSTPDIFYTPGFRACMSINRFILLNRCLHFANNEDMRALQLDYFEARLYKIQPVLSHLNMKFQSLYTPGQNIALDESLLMWKGWLDIGQLIPNKAANQGIKTYEICESQTGYLWRFEIHSHKKNSTPSQQLADPLGSFTPSIVLRLTQGLEHKGYTLWMDSFYNSPCLARRLKCLGFDCVGTLRTDRKFVPQALHSLTKKNMEQGQVAALTSGDVDVMVWRDSNRVALISTYHGNAQATVRGSTKPILVMDYNIMMGGVDKKDQLLSMYPIERKRTQVWYKKLFRRLLNVSVLNAFVIYNHNPSRSLSHRNFRITLIKSILSKHASPTSLPPATTLNVAITPNVLPDLTHRLDYLGMGPRQPKRRICRGCKKQTSTYCVGCGKTSCIPCFTIVHS